MKCEVKKIECDYSSSDILGMKYIPSLEPVYSDTSDYIKEIVQEEVNLPVNDGNGQFSTKNALFLADILKRSNAKVIVEIGVARKHTFMNSSTHILLDNKDKECQYYGIDLRDEGIYEYTTYQPNVNILIGSSSDTKIIEVVYNANPIDLLHIDGDHSIKGFLSDWQYVRFVRNGGYIVAHDTNNHPGPNLFFDAVDEKKYRKMKMFVGENDNGMAVFQKMY